ncbi:MAG: hypothetical protein IJY39_09545 [Clostridia bacterium]|nr:hypothetical protein [Clostridia bacterium]
MPSVQQHISKGFYKYSQIDRFISVKNYMFVRANNRKCLMIRFSNDSDFTVNSMDFVIVQLDSAGALLATTKISYDSLSVAPGNTYTPDEGIIVDEFCTDFKIQFSCVCSGNYKYLVKKGKIAVLYQQEEGALVPAQPRYNPVSKFSVKPLKTGKPALAVFLGVCVLILVTLLNLNHMYWRYKEATEEETTEASEAYTEQDFEYRESFSEPEATSERMPDN